MRIFWTIVIVFLFFSRVHSQAKSMDLDKVIQLALQNNIDLLKLQERLAMAQHALDEANATKFTSVDLKASYSRFSEVMQMDIVGISVPGTPINIPGRSIRFGDEDNYEALISLIQPLFTGHRISSMIKANRESVRASQMQSVALKNQVKFNATKAFYNLIKAYEMKKIAEASYQQVKTHLRDIQNFYQQGLVAQNDVLTGEVKLSEVELLIINAENAIELANTILLNLLNLNLDQTILPEYDPEKFSSAALEPVVEKAVSNKPEVKMLDFQIASLQFKRKAAAGAYWPNVALFGNYIYGKPGLDKIANEWISYWIGGIQLQWNLWDWGKKSAQVQQVQSAINELKLGKAQLTNNLAVDIKRTQINLRSSRKRLQNSIKMLESAEENYRIIENRYREGIISNSEYLDAQSDLTRAKVQRIQSQIDLQIALADYERACAEAE